MKTITNCNGHKITAYYYADNPRKNYMEVSTKGKRTVYVTNSLARAIEYAQNH